MKDQQRKKSKSVAGSAGRKLSYQSGVSTDFMSSIHSNSGDRAQENKSSFTQTMHERWHKANMVLPECDIKDIMEENPNFNAGKKISPEH